MNNQVDVLNHPIDERARNAARALNRSASLRELPDRVVPTSPVRRTVALSLAMVALLVGGLIVIGNRWHESELAGTDDDLHWVIDGLGQGWAPVEIRGPRRADEPVAASGEPVMTIFASGAAPSGLILRVAFSDDPGWAMPAVDGAIDFEEVTVDGVDLVLGTFNETTRSAWTRVDDGWVPSQATSMTREEVLNAVAHLTIGGDGSAQIDARYLPAGLTRLTSGSMVNVAPALFAHAFQGLAPGTITTTYSSASDPGPSVWLTVSRDEGGGQVAYLGSGMIGMTSMHVGDIKVWKFPARGGTASQVVWRRDGLIFLLSSYEPDLFDLPALAADVRLVSADEWSTYLAASAPRPDQPSGTELAGTVPANELGPDSIEASANTDPPPVRSDEVRDITLDWTIIDKSDHRATLTTTLSNGSTSSVAVTIVGDSVSLSTTDLGSMIFPWAPGDPTRLEWQGIGAFTVTDDPAAARMRVLRANGDRYTVDLVTVLGEPETKFAIITLRANDFVSMDLLDVDDNVLEHYESSDNR